MEHFTPRPEVNPYAAPAVPDAVLPEQVDAGVWRDGPLVVLKKGHTLPALCLKTGLPADQWQTETLTWFTPWGVWPAWIHVPVPLSRMAVRKGIVLSRCCYAAAAVCGALLAIAVARMSQLDARTARMTIGPLAVTILILLLVALRERWLLSIAQVRGNADLIWLAGARESFLRHLPPWRE
jgi:hypothetical protein